MAVVERIKNSDVNLQERLIRRAWEDEQFAELLRTNPRVAIAEETGVELPGDIDIQVHQEDETTLHLVVPEAPEATRETIKTPVAGTFGGVSQCGDGEFHCTHEYHSCGGGWC